MKYFLSVVQCTMLVCLAAGVTASTAPGGDDTRPNWTGGGAGTTTPEGGVDVDEFSGRSSHVGQFIAEGFHALNPVDFTFAGEATWTAANGDTLEVTYTGQIFLSGDPVYPFGFVAELVAEGGTGRLSGARGRAAMSGAFTGRPGEFYFDFEGTLDSNGK